MRSRESVTRLARSPFVGNFVAQAGALGSLALATLIVARAGGPAAVGYYALLRLLPWLMAMIVSGGLANAVSYFLAGPTRDDRSVRSTVLVVGLGTALTGAVLWVIASPIMHRLLLRDVAIGLIALAAFKVVSRMVVMVAKAASQGTHDLHGSNRAILLEELAFLPPYVAFLLLGVSQPLSVIGALVLADVLTGITAWVRLSRRGFFVGMGAPSLSTARRLFLFGTKGQIGNLMALLNLRLNLLMVGLLTGPIPLGIYAVASKYAELVRPVSIAANWVLYPRFAADSREQAAARAKRMMTRLGLITAIATIPLMVGAAVALPVVYGREFSGAILPAQWLLVGLAADGVAGVITAFLFGRGRPGLNSVGAGAGLLATVLLDLLFIPRWGLVGAAVASSIAYLTTTGVLCIWYLILTRSDPASSPVVPGLKVRPPGRGHRVLDLALAVPALVLLAPAMVVIGLAAWISTGGRPIFRQRRVGEGGVPFTLYKFRSMRPGCKGAGVTSESDPRITRVGAFLRSSSLDELPQLVNVIRGEMSLVGPRPESVELALRYPEQYRKVFEYRPGLTGLAQLRFRDNFPAGLEDVEGHYLTEMVPRRVAVDMAFQEDATVWSTLGVMARTVRYILGGSPPGADDKPPSDPPFVPSSNGHAHAKEAADQVKVSRSAKR